MGTSDEDNKDDTNDVENDGQILVPTFGRWLLLAAGAVNFGCGLGLPISLSVMFLDWQESFSTTRAVTAAVHSTCVGIVFGGGVVAGYVVNRFGARVSFVLGSFLATLGMFLGAFATSIPFLLATVGILAGCGCCLMQLPTIPCITRAFRKNQGVAIAAVATGGAIVTLAIPYLYDYLIQTYSWRGAFIIIGGLCLNTLVLELVLTSYIPVHSAQNQLTISVPSPEATQLVSHTDDVLSCEPVNSNGSCIDQETTPTYDGIDHTSTAVRYSEDSNCLNKDKFSYNVSHNETVKGDANVTCLSNSPLSIEVKPGAQPLTAAELMEDRSTVSSLKVTQSCPVAGKSVPHFAQSEDSVCKHNIGEQDESEYLINQSSDLTDTIDQNHALSNKMENVQSGTQEETECFTESSNQLPSTDPNNDFQKSNVQNIQCGCETNRSNIDVAFVPTGMDIKVNTSSVASFDSSNSRHFVTRLRHSAWKFLLYPLTWSVLAFLGLTLGVQFTSQMLTMDIAANKGFPEYGLFLIMLGIVSGLVGKILSAMIGLCRKWPSFLVLGASGVLGSGALAMMGIVTSLRATAVSVGIIGLSLGLIVSVFPKCFLDLPSMDADSYPLALGLGNTVEGVFDFLVPILVGHMVDVSGTYTLPFSMLSAVSFLCSCVLMLVYRWTKHKGTA